MTRIPIKTLLAVMIALAISGGWLRGISPHEECSLQQPSRRCIEMPSYGPPAGIVHDFGSIPYYKAVRCSLIDQMTSGCVLEIDLLQAACLAAANSQLAELLEAERRAILCQTGGSGANAIDIILQGEALEERNVAAGAAVELTLGLVQIQLQRGLIEESKLHLAQLARTIQDADDAGFATADGKHELAEGETRVKKAESELNLAEQELTLQLNLLLNTDPENLIIFTPVHELAPQAVELNLRQEILIAKTDRPGIRALETAVSRSNAGDSVYPVLKQMDPRLGIRLPPAPIKNKLFRHQIKELLKQYEASDSSGETRNVQLHRIIEARKQAASTEVVKAMLQIQNTLEKLAIINEDIARLDARHQQLEGKQEIDARDSYLELNRNWVKLQQAKSDRVAVAIEHDVAILKLLQAQGHLVFKCGYNFTPCCGVPINAHCL